MRKNALISFLLAAGLLGAQEGSLSRYEKCWALAHPFAALKVKKISRKCDVLYRHGDFLQQLDSFASGGKDDAFRHVFYMAAFSQRVKPVKLRKLGEAHEKANRRQFRRSQLEHGERPDSLSSVMDLMNNELGLKLGSSFCKLTLLELERMVVFEINQGSAVIMKRNKKGEYLACDGSALELKAYTGKWSVPKCLVPSNTPYR